MPNLGDQVRINHHAKPRYPHGIQGVVVELDQHAVTVCMHRPVGRFTTGEIRCPPLILDGSSRPPDINQGETIVTMSPIRQTDPELDNLIDEITADAHDEDEQLMGFENAFDEHASFPCPGTIIGQQVDVLSVSRANHRQELTATCQRDGRRYEVALLDIDLKADPATSRLVSAYRRWIGD